MFCWIGDEEVGHKTLTVPCVMEVASGGGGRCWDQGTEESVRFRVGNGTAVIDECFRGVLDS